MELITIMLNNQVNLTYVCVALVVITVILLVLAIRNGIAVNKLRKKYESFMDFNTDEGISLTELLDTYIDESRQIASKMKDMEARTTSLEHQILCCFQKVGVVRYNPFDDTGGDLSYVIALLNSDNNGFILNGIFNRDGSYTYAKEIENGVSQKHKLSGEELEALQMALTNGLCK